MLGPLDNFALGDPIVSSRGAKSCTLSAGKDGKAIFTLGSRHAPVSTPFGASSYNDENNSRKTLDLRLNPEQDGDFLCFDEWAVRYITEHSERLFKKTLTQSQVQEHYRSPVTRKEGYQPLLRCKINVSGRSCVRVWDEENLRTGLPDDLRMYEMCPRLHLSHLWIMGRDFGWVIQCNDLMCLNGAAEADCPFVE